MKPNTNQEACNLVDILFDEQFKKIMIPEVLNTPVNTCPNKFLKFICGEETFASVSMPFSSLNVLISSQF